MLKKLLIYSATLFIVSCGVKINNATDMCMYLLNKVYVAIVSGEAFGDTDCVRISYSTSEENLIESVRRIREALGKLK